MAHDDGGGAGALSKMSPAVSVVEPPIKSLVEVARYLP